MYCLAGAHLNATVARLFLSRSILKTILEANVSPLHQSDQVELYGSVTIYTAVILGAIGHPSQVSHCVVPFVARAASVYCRAFI